MPEFQSCYVAPALHSDPFVRAYLEAADKIARWLGPDCEPDGFSAESVSQAAADCDEFREAAAAYLTDYYEAGYTESQAALDFWLTRNHHGAGFWDRGLPGDLGQRLTESAHQMGEKWLYCGDDNLLYFTP